ncbi:MAG: ribosome-associated translation inhibitor RaiA [Bacteroidaceae bacterium]|jgi:putative sigma-54 modulation protein|uniref:ribosome hibernation-promoting factor, HPF/YfiA family n=1 Tax=unclassified Bacteroides TaxID=2646097 RepID=UPI0004E1A1EC|nr:MULTISPECIES: ribosome-associated translation inhibitor RaiA [unclassified Bacteroides]MBO4597395.1 ribosome-associated translation inhibitor RaiA [Bacteroidaceae bacterium]SDG36995.1 putative sigma-54 modulation protein [Bacteroidales bacterium KHT7]MBP3245701.1 ribosome-associated translation inhibitor RaiA [Bacteroidaceae bacterium]MBQ1677272.1 ribosome-associated translation inhibitor RaiA [Bacteroidaceae bacterium]MBQ4461550.1 ribosome-associated translation inhibitor RaiA [Bacteroidac
MEAKIHAIHFDASDQLQAFIAKKTAKLEKFSEEIGKVEVSLKVVKPETSLNKYAGIRVSVPGEDLFAEKICDSFEEAVDLSIDALVKQIQKYKEKQRSK